MNRYQRYSAVGSLTIAALLGGAGACGRMAYDNPPAPTDTTHETITTQPDTGVTLAPTDGAGTVAAVHDGDTFTLADGQRVRFIGIDAPEIHGAVDGPSRKDNDDCWGAEATKALQDILRPGDPVTLKIDRTNKDRYGRLLRYVELSNGLDVGEAMVINGNAKAKRYGKDVARADKYDVAQAVAKEYGRGLWSEC